MSFLPPSNVASPGNSKSTKKMYLQSVLIIIDAERKLESILSHHYKRLIIVKSPCTTFDSYNKATAQNLFFH